MAGPVPPGAKEVTAILRSTPAAFASEAQRRSGPFFWTVTVRLCHVVFQEQETQMS